MNRHIDIDILSRYLLNRLTQDEETAVQEHLRQCPECAGRLEAMRKLRNVFFEDTESQDRKSVIFRIVRSRWTKVAAAVIIVAGIGLFTAETVRNRSNILEQHEIVNGDNPDNEVFAVDTFDKKDSTYYRKKYGDDFKF